MNNILKDKNLEEVKIQLKRSEVKKNTIVKNIYKEYEIYFQIIRKSILDSVEKGIFSIYSDFSIDEKVLNSAELINFLNERISTLIHSKLPLITIEQLKLGTYTDPQEKFLNTNNLKDSSEDKKYKIINYDYVNNSEGDLNNQEFLEFHLNKKSYDYYRSFEEDELLSVNLDEDHNNNSLFEKKSFKKIENKTKFADYFPELVEESNGNKLNNYEDLNIQISDVFISTHNLNFFESIDKSLSALLLNLSYEINSELFKINIINKIINENTFMHLSNKNYVIKHPCPFVINYNLNPNNTFVGNNKTAKIILFNVTNVELEFYNLDLSISRNNINDLKNQFRSLNKKYRYWKSKELTLKNSN